MGLVKPNFFGRSKTTLYAGNRFYVQRKSPLSQNYEDNGSVPNVIMTSYAPPDLSFPSVALVDNFNRTENPNSGGGNWITGLDGGAPNAFKANGTTLVNVDGTAYASQYYNKLFTNPELQVKANDGANYVYFGVQPASLGGIVQGYFLLGWSQGGLSTIDLYVHDVGLQVVIASYPAFLNTGDLIGIRRLATKIQAFLNGVQILEVENTYWTGPGYVGLSTDTATLTNGFDDFYVGEYNPAIEYAQYTDPSTISSVLFTPSGPDVYAPGAVIYTDSATDSLLLTPSSTDIVQDVDSATNYLSLTPSAADIELDVDATTARVTFTPGPLIFGPNVPILYSGTATENPISDGGKWDSPVEVGDGVLKSDGTSFYGAVAATFSSAFRTDQYWANGEVRVDSPQGAGTAHYLGLRVPIATLGGMFNGYWLQWPEDVGERFDIYKYVAGTPTSLGTFDIPHNINGGEPIFFGANGTSLYVRVEENYLGSVTDSTFSNAGRVGIATDRTAAVGFKNFGAGALNDITGYIDTSPPNILLTPSGPDVYTASGTTYTDSATDSLLLTPSAAETEQAVDSQTATLSLIPSSTETAQYVDQNTEPLKLTPSSTDVAAFVDSNTDVVTLTPFMTFEEHTTFDSNTDTILLIPSSSDIAAYVDTNTSTTSLISSGTEVAAYVDQNTPRATISPSGTDISAFVDANTGINNLVPSSSDLASTIDSNTGQVTISTSALDVAVYIDQNTGIVLFTPTMTAEDHTTYDATTGIIIGTPSGVDISVFLDSGTSTVSLIGSAADSATFIDSSTAKLVFTTTFTELAAYVDSSTGLVIFVPSSSDIAVYIDSSTGLVLLSPTGIEGAVVDANTGLIISTGSSTDIAAYVDSNNAISVITPSSSDSLVPSIQDSGTGVTSLTPSSIDIAAYVDASTGVIVSTPVGSEISGDVDSNTSNVLINPSSSDIAIFVDANSSLVTSTPSSSDAATYVETSTPVVGLKPSGADIAAFVDTTIGLIRFTGGDIADAAEVYTRITASALEGEFIAILLMGHAWRHWVVQEWKQFSSVEYPQFTVEATKG